MKNQHPEKPHILFLFSDTGGGHRSAAEAIIEAIDLEFPGRFSTEMIDFFRQYAPPPFDIAPEIYPPLTKVPDVWELGYRFSDDRRRSRLMTSMIWPYIRRASRRLLSEHPCDLLVSVHPLMNAPVLRNLPEPRVPFVTVVTDMVTSHAMWYDNRADMVLVPTELARHRGLQMGLSPDKLEVVGQPVAERFCQPPPGDQQALRARLGWPLDQKIILLVGGGEGMGPLLSTACAIDEAQLPAALVIIAGRNRKLKKQLENHKWQVPVHIYSFVREMPDFMRASDILVTKAGPGTVSEAFIAGLPIILYSRLPGQEDGNVTYVVDEGAGIWAPDPEMVVTALKNWLDFPETRQKAVDACQRIARPQASRRIARVLARFAAKENNPAL